jgi:hypothetical protein
LDVKEIREYRLGLKDKNLSEIQKSLQELGDAFQFQPGTFLDTKLLKEAEVTLNDIYAELIKNRKKEVKLTPKDEEAFDDICSYSSDLLDKIRGGTKGKDFYKDAKVLGRKLNQMANKIGKFVSVVVSISLFSKEFFQ